MFEFGQNHKYTFSTNIRIGFKIIFWKPIAIVWKCNVFRLISRSVKPGLWKLRNRSEHLISIYLNCFHSTHTCHSLHYNDVMMSSMASQITSLTVVYSTVYSRRRSNKISKLRVTGLCEGNSLVAGEFPAQMSSNAENVSIWWRHRVKTKYRQFVDFVGCGGTVSYNCGNNHWQSSPLVFSVQRGCTLGLLEMPSTVSVSVVKFKLFLQS